MRHWYVPTKVYQGTLVTDAWGRLHDNSSICVYCMSTLQVGAAEAHLALARLAQGAGDSAAAQSACHEAIVHYEAALRLPHKLPGFKHRCETR